MRLASGVEDGFPYKDRGVVYYRVDKGLLQVIGNHREMARLLVEMPKIRRVYATWHGHWKTDMFLVDSIAELKKVLL